MSGFAVVTGAASGIGREVVEQLVASGVETVPWVRSDAQGEQLLNHLSVKKYVACDLRDHAQIRRSLSALVEEIGAPTLVVQAAGVSHVGAVESMSVETTESLLATNFGAVVALTQACVPHMFDGSRIINIGSSASIVGSGPHLMSLYAATKSAVRAFSIDINKELQHVGISVSAAIVGGCDTSMFDSIVASAKVLHAESGRYAKSVAYLNESLASVVGRLPSSSEVASEIVARGIGEEALPLEFFVPSNIESVLRAFEQTSGQDLELLLRAVSPAEFASIVERILRD